LAAITLSYAKSPEDNKARFDVGAALSSYIADDDWTAFEDHIGQLVKKHRLDVIRDSLRARFAGVDRRELRDKLLADYDNGIGMVLFNANYYREALSYFERAAAQCSAHNNAEGVRVNIVNRALCYALLCDTSASLVMFRQMVDPLIRDRTIYNQIYGDPETFVQEFYGTDRIRALADSLIPSDTALAAGWYYILGYAFYRNDEYAAARAALEQARVLYDRTADPAGLFYTTLYLAENAAASDSTVEDNNTRFLALVLEMMRCDSTGYVGEALSSWFKKAAGDAFEIRFDSLALETFDRYAAAEPDRAILRGRLQFYIGSNPEFVLEPAARIDLFRGYLASPRTAADTLRPIAARWNLMELYTEIEQPDSARNYFLTVWKTLRRVRQLYSLEDLIRAYNTNRQDPDPYRGLALADRALAVILDNLYRTNASDAPAPSLDSTRAAYRFLTNYTAKTEVWAHTLMSEFYRSAYAGLPDSAEYYFWRSYKAMIDAGDTAQARYHLEQLTWLDGYDPFAYLDRFDQSLRAFGPAPATALKAAVADHLSHQARDSYTAADEFFSLRADNASELNDPRTEPVAYYRDVIRYFQGETELPLDHPGRWAIVNSDPGVTRTSLDTVNAYLDALNAYNRDQGTDPWVTNYLAELRGCSHLAWAGRLTGQADAYYRECARFYSDSLSRIDPDANPGVYFGSYRLLAQTYAGFRDDTRLLRSYDSLAALLGDRIYNKTTYFDQAAVCSMVVAAARRRGLDYADILHLELRGFAQRVIEWGGGGFGAGAGYGGEKYENRIMKPVPIYDDEMPIVKYIKPVTFYYIETRSPEWTGNRIRTLPRILGRFGAACREDVGFARRWDLLSALIYAAADDFPSADSVLRAASRPDSTDAWLAAVLGLTRGSLRRVAGDYSAAVREFQTARGRIEDLVECDLLAACLSGETGNTYFNLGDLARADTEYKRAIAVADVHDDWRLFNARLRLTAGNVRFVTGLTGGDPAAVDTAIEYYYQALGLMGRDWELNTYLTVNLNLAIANQIAGRRDTAVALARAVLIEADDDSMHLEAAWARTILGYFYFQNGDYAAANAALDSASGMYRVLGDRYDLSNCLSLLGATRRRLGQSDAAYQALKESIELYETIWSGLSPSDAVRAFCRRNEDRYAEMVQLLMDQDSIRLAFQYLERSKSAKLKEVFSGLTLETGDEKLDAKLENLRGGAADIGRLEARLTEEKSLPPEQRDSAAIKVLDTVLARNRAELEELLVDLEMNNPEIYSLLAVKPQLFVEDRIRQAIPEGAVFLEYFPSETNLYIFVFTRDTLSVRAVAVTRARIDSLVLQFRSLIGECAQSLAGGFGVDPIPDWRDDGSSRYRSEIKPLKDLLEELYGYLIGPVEDEVLKSRVAVIIPAGSLYYLPFHALAREANGTFEFLLEKVKVAYLSSSTMMDALTRRDAKFTNLLAFGDPDGSLRGALDEVKAIANIVPKSEVLTLGQATESMVKSLPDNFSVLHLATHAILNNLNPKASYIVFAPDEKAGEDGRLDFGEILRIPLKKKTMLVTLSACQTAVGKNPSGSEVISLTRAFTSAGAPSILSTLWPVEDLATRSLMVGFYQNLIRGDKAGSLRDAQLALLKNPATAHPFFWAPFVLIGDWQ
jgi:tetratricopeptide (TPR) repeat protein